MNGGRHTYYPSDNDEIIEVESWDEVIRMTVRDDNEVTGWIAPDGEFFGCNARNHDLMARYYFHKEQTELEESGWIKVYEEPVEILIMHLSQGKEAHRYGAIILRQFATDNQKITLEQKGFTEISPRHWAM